MFKRNRVPSPSPFPNSITLDGIEYPIKTSYRVVWQWMKLADNQLLEPEYKINGTLLLFFYNDPHDPFGAIEAIHSWLLCGEKPYESAHAAKTYDFHKDYLAVRAGFLSQYGIDLNKDLAMHWWDFKSRFDELSDKTKIKQIMQIRDMPLPDPKDQEYYSRVVEAKERLSLD